MNDPVSTKCRGTEIISEDAPVEYVMTCRLLFLSTAFFQPIQKFLFPLEGGLTRVSDRGVRANDDGGTNDSKLSGHNNILTVEK